MKRRDALSLIPLSLTGLARAASGQTLDNMRYDHPMVGAYKEYCHEAEFGIPLSAQYLSRVRDMLVWIRETQSENLLEASYAIADTVEKGHTCWCAWDMGHNTNFDMFPERNGVPEIITMGYAPEKSRKGDLFLASIWGGPHEDLVKKDIFVIGGPAPWGGDSRGQHLLSPDVRERRLRPYSKIWIETNITTVGAIMYLPGMPAPTGPVSGIVGLTTYWMMLADACRVLAKHGKSVPVRGDEPVLDADAPRVSLYDPLMDDYFEQLMLEIEMIGSERGNMRKIARMAVDAVLDGGRVWVYSRYRNSLSVEAQTRRGGLTMTRGIHEQDGKLITYAGDFEPKPNDIVIMGVWEPDDEADLRHLDSFRRAGLKVASIGPATRNLLVPEGRTVPKETDVHIGRMCDTYGLFAIPGFDRHVCPTSGALINQMFWATCMEIVDEMRDRTGDVPGVFFSAALKGGRPHMHKMQRLFEERGY